MAPRRAAVRASGVVLVVAALGLTTAVAKSSDGTPKPPDAAAAKVLAAASDHLGDTYVYGATGPESWDCSGLTSTLWRTVGGVAAIPRTSRDQQAWAWPLRPQDARPGDLVFFGSPVTHVGLYEGDGRIIDASSSRHAVVERAIWTSDVVRYGRVPRAGVTHPAPPPAPAPASPTAPPAAKPSPAPTGTTGSGTGARAGSGGASGAPGGAGATATGKALRPIPPAGHQPKTPTTKAMAAFVAALRTRIGSRWQASGTGPAAFDAAGLVRWAWARCGYGTLPTTPAALERLTKPVALADLAVGDLIFYGKPAVHVAVYVGNGLMIDASRVLKVVSQRRVFASETVRFARLTVPRR